MNLNDIQIPDAQEGVMKKETNISHKTVTAVGDVMNKKTQRQMEIGLKIFYTILAVYGFLAFLNPKEFPIIRGFLENTPYFYIAQYDRLFGVVLTVIGLYLLQEK